MMECSQQLQQAPRKERAVCDKLHLQVFTLFSEAGITINIHGTLSS